MSKSNKTMLIINGLIAIIFGIIALLLPEQTILTIIRYLGLLFIVAGAIILIIAYNKRAKQQSVTVQTIQGIVALILGLALLIFSRQSIMLVVIIFGAWAVVLGLMKIYLLARFKHTKRDKYVLIISALLSIVLGVMLFLNPYKIAALMITMVGLIALVVGVMTIYIALRSEVA